MQDVVARSGRSGAGHPEPLARIAVWFPPKTHPNHYSFRASIFSPLQSEPCSCGVCIFLSFDGGTMARLIMSLKPHPGFKSYYICTCVYSVRFCHHVP